MPRTLQTRKFEASQVVGGTTGQGISTSILPAAKLTKLVGGDEGWYELFYRWWGEFNASANGSAVVTDGVLKFIRSVVLESVKHGRIVDGLSGLQLHRLQTYQQGTRPKFTPPATANDGATFRGALRIALARSRSKYRELDTILDVAKTNCEMSITFGKVTDLITGGTAPEIINLNHRVDALVLPGLQGDPAVDPTLDPAKAGDLPAWQPYYGVIEEPVVSGQTSKQIELPAGDRAYILLLIQQWDTSNEVEVDDVLAHDAEITLRNNDIHVIDRVAVGQLKDQMESHYQLETAPTGIIPLDFDKMGFASGWLDTFQTPARKCVLELPVTYAANRQLRIIYHAVKRIKPEARRG